MNIQIFNEDGATIWAYGETNGQSGGIACKSYAEDGTQMEILDIITKALIQASAEMDIMKAVQK